MTNTSRVSPGTPDGGQFSTTPKQPADLSGIFMSALPAGAPEWATSMSAEQFEATHGHPGIDRDFGEHWDGKFRVSLRLPHETPSIDGTTTGVLYAHDTYTGQYVVLGTNKTSNDVAAAYEASIERAGQGNPTLADLQSEFDAVPSATEIGTDQNHADALANNFADWAEDLEPYSDSAYGFNRDYTPYAEAKWKTYSDAAAQVGEPTLTLTKDGSAEIDGEYDDEGRAKGRISYRRTGKAADAATTRSQIRSIVDQAFEANDHSNTDRDAWAGRRDALVEIAASYDLNRCSELAQIDKSAAALRDQIRNTDSRPSSREALLSTY